MKKPSAKGWIVVFDDEMGACVPFSCDTDCPGAICYSDGDIVVFETHLEARMAIQISAAWARLQAARGDVVNTDFTEGRKHLRIRRLRAWTR